MRVIHRRWVMKLRDLIPWAPETKALSDSDRDPFSTFEREFREMTRRFWDTDLAFTDTAGMITPRVDVKSDDHAITVTAEIPGVDQKDIHVTFEKNHLIISGEKKQEHEEKKEGYHRRERTYGSFRRVIPIDHEVKEGEAKAHFKNGVLTVELPRTEEDKKKSRSIPVASG